MNIIFGITTYNRIDYLKRLINSWNETKNHSYTYHLVIADDLSTDGTRDYIKDLNFPNTTVKIILNNRRGVHHQVNQILRFGQTIKYDLGFLSEDDIYFTDRGWDDLYLRAHKLSGLDHLCYFNQAWACAHQRPQCCKKPSIISKARNIQCCVQSCWDAFGVFWTFSPRVISKVGFFDLQNMGLWGSGHTDYSMRCCRAGMNSCKPFWDAYESEKYIAMIDENYKASLTGPEMDFSMYYNIPNLSHKGRTIDNHKRIFVPYNELPYDMKGNPL